MTGSRIAHASFSEDVRKTLSGKGREGNKEGKGTRGETSIHSHLGNAREATSPSPVESATAWMGQIR